MKDEDRIPRDAIARTDRNAIGRQIIQVVAAVIESHGTLLIAQRPKEKRYAGQWEFPGGKVEHGETFHEALRRELMEELNVRVVSTGNPHFIVAEPDSQVVINYVATTIRGDAHPNEHAALAWVSPNELLTYDLAPGDRAYALFRQAQSTSHLGLR